MNNKNKNYRIMKFLEPVGKADRARGYVRLDMRGTRGTIIVSVENIGDQRTVSEVYLFKNKNDKIKIGMVNNRKGMVKKSLMFSSQDTSVEDYNICGVVKDDRVVMYAPLFAEASLSEVKKLDSDVQAESVEQGEASVEDGIQGAEDEAADAVREETEEAMQETESPAGESEMPEISEISEISEAKEQEETKQDEAFNESEDVTREAKAEEAAVCEADALEASMGDSGVSEAVKAGEYENDVKAEDEEAEIHIEETVPANEGAADDSETDDGGEAEQEIQSLRTGKGRKKYKNEFEENLYTVLEGFEKITPLSVDIKNLSWWAVRYDEKGASKGFLPYYNQVISTYYPYPMSNRVTTCQGLMKKYGYYIFGVYKEAGEIKKFVYGVPGEFRRDEQPYKGITGFKNWSYKNKDIKGDYGYWLAFVDAKTGDVTDPPKIDMDR